MRTTAISLNPFSLMMEPEAVLHAVENSPSLKGLRRRTLRPLDRPLIPFVNPPQDNDLADLNPAELAQASHAPRADLND